jgi:hypothetical protein
MGDLSQYLNPDRESARMGGALTQTLNKAQEFLRLQNSLDFAKPLQDLRKQLDNPTFWQVQSIGELDEQIKKSADSLDLLNAALDQGKLPNQLEVMRNNMNTLLDIIYVAAQEKAISRIKNAKNLTPEDRQNTINQTNKYFDFIRKVKPEEALKELSKAGPDQIWQSLRETLVSYQKFFAQLPQIASRLTTLSADAVKASIAEARQQATNLRPEIIEAYGRFTELLKSMIPGGYSLSKANASSDLDAQQFVRGQLLSADASVLQDPQQVAAILAEGEKLRLQYQKANEILHPLRAALENFETRVRLAASITEAYASASRGLLEDFLSGSTDFREAMANFAQTISQGFISQFLDIAMAPMKEQVFERMKKLFGVQSAEDKAKLAMDALAASQTSLGQKTDQLKDTISRTTDVLTSIAAGIGGPDLDAGTSGLPYGIKIGDTVGSFVQQNKPVAVPVIPFTDPYAAPDNIDTMANLQGEAALKEPLENFGKYFTEFGSDVNDTAATGEKGFTKFLGGMMGVATGALAITGAIQAMQDSKGGTYGTLMGIAGILGGLGAIAGGVGGIMKRASGGPVTARRPYIVGEVGPELFMPEGNGTIIPNKRLRENRAYLESSDAEISGSTKDVDAGQAADLTAATRIALRESNRLQETRTQVMSQQLATERRYERERIEQMTKTPNSLSIKYESQVINSVEYVTREQAERMSAQSALQGRELALSSLQNSVKARKRVGIF